MNSKLIEYAYPSSTTATKEGYGKTGCWLVGLYREETSCLRIKILKTFPTKKDAEQYAEALPLPYNFMHKYHNK